jgi:glyoxylase-like metal-dependent hydrolase (beta-lactamase superfamily II)/8-oxo-dGTP pyrophosphatase MutT (NUDIX family)
MGDSTAIAASVILLHRRARAELEVYWVRRADNLAFLGGFWAFPGGRVEPEDFRVEVSGHSGDAAARIVAAARELFEETGLRVPADARHFVAMGRVVSPEWATVRFDATYYAVEVPADAAPDWAHAQGELSAGEWITPGHALELWACGERLTSPIVVGALQIIAADQVGDAEVLEAKARAHRLGRAFELLPGLGLCALRTPTLPPATHTNCYIVGGRELIVIDPATPYPDEQAVLDEALDGYAQAGRRVREIWLTHHHVDHVSGAAHLAERLSVPVCAHEITAKLVQGHLRVSRVLRDAEVTELGGDAVHPTRRLRPVFTPGHAPGHLCFLEETTQFLITGDMVAGIGTIIVDPDEGDMAEYLASLERMKALDVRVLLPAHGPPLPSPQRKLDEYIHHRLWREARVLEALTAKGEASAAELVTDVYKDVAPSLFALAERSLQAHLIKLARDGRAHKLGGTRYRVRPGDAA